MKIFFMLLELSLSGTSTRIKLKTACRSCPERCDRHEAGAFCLLLSGLVRYGRWAGWIVSSPPHVDRSRARRVLSPSCSDLHAHPCRPGDPTPALSLSLTILRKFRDPSRRSWCSRSSPLSPCALRIRSDVLDLAMASVHRRPSPALCPTPLLLRDGSEASSAVSSRPSIHDIRPIGLVSSSSATSATARRSPQEGAEPAFSQAATVFIRHPPRFRVSQ